jgi:hypothetical protein
VHQHCGLGVEGILKNSLYRQSLDNVTVVVVAFSNFKRQLCGHSEDVSLEVSKSTKSLVPPKQVAPVAIQRSSSLSGPQNVIKLVKEQENNLNLTNKTKPLIKKPQTNVHHAKPPTMRT